MTSPSQWEYTTRMIRLGFEKQDVDMFGALCNQVKLDIGSSRTYMFLLLDMARHNDVDVLEIIKMGRVCSEQKNVNEKFMEAVFLAVSSNADAAEEGDAKPGVLDLTADEESGSYEEEEGEGPFDNADDNPTSADAYEIDGFVVEDHEEDKPEPAYKALNREGPATVKVSGLARSNALVKRKLATILESDEE